MPCSIDEEQNVGGSEFQIGLSVVTLLPLLSLYNLAAVKTVVKMRSLAARYAHHTLLRWHLRMQNTEF